MAEHRLKTWPEYFQSMWTGEKTFELRKNDRDFNVNDTLILLEYDPDDDSYSGRRIHATVRFILYGGKFGLPDDLCIMSLDNAWRVS